MTVISERTFISCSKLTLDNLHLNWADLTSIGAKAFSGCSSLKGEETLEYPEGKPVKVRKSCHIEADAFTNCPLRYDKVL